MNTNNFITTDKREQKISRLTDINICCQTEEKRLFRKLLPLNKIIHDDKLTVIGSLQEIKQQIKKIEKQKKDAINERKKITKEISKNKATIYLNEQSIERLNQMKEMEKDVNNFIINNKKINNNIKKSNSNKNNNITDPLLIQIQNDLPPEMLRCIQEFFTHSTLCELWEDKNKPFQKVNKFKPNELRDIIHILMDRDVSNYFDQEIKNTIIQKYNVFYYTHIIHGVLNRKRSHKDELIFLKHILLCFREKSHRNLLGIYKFIHSYNSIEN